MTINIYLHNKIFMKAMLAMRFYRRFASSLRICHITDGVVMKISYPLFDED